MRTTIALIAIATLLTGCNNPNPDNLTTRLKAATNITDSNTKQTALAKLAEDAASAGKPDTTTAALQKITDTNLRNTTAHKTALTLAKAGHTTAATTIAQTITDTNQKDETLSQIAKNQYDNK